MRARTGNGCWQIGLAIAPSSPSHVYALIEAKKGMLWGSIDFGDHWTSINESHMLDVRPFYFSHLAVAPNDENKLYFLSYSLAESTDGGKTAHRLDKGVHVDHHALWIDPTNPERMIDGNDGGAYITVNGGRNWRYLDNLPIEQFYQVAADTSTPYNLCGGLQDNFGWCGPSNSGGRPGVIGSDWYTTLNGDGEYVVPAPGAPNIIYSDSQNGELLRLDNKTGLSTEIRPYMPGVSEMSPSKLKYRFNWTSPVAVAERNPNEVYLGGNVLFKSSDAGAHWTVISPDLTRNDKAKQVTSGGSIEYDISGAETYDTLLSFALSQVDPNVIWTGSDDGVIQMTRDGGQHWSDVSAHVSALPQWGRVQQIEASPSDAATCYVAIDFHETDDNRPFVFKTHDYGRTWQAISRGLPSDAPARVIRENPNQRGMLVVGTDTGLFYSKDDGGTWSPLKGNFPTVPIYDIKFVKASHDLVVATHGRGLFVLDRMTPLEQFTPELQAGNFHLFASAPAHLMHSWNKHGETQPGFIAPNPPPGASIDYYLKSEIKKTPELEQKHETPVKITITDAQGRLVRTLYGPSDAGFNRTVWDLTYNPAKRLLFEKMPEEEEDEEEFDQRRGPRVIPGTYKIGIVADKFAEIGSVTVEADPRFPVDVNAFVQQNRLALELNDELSAVNEMLNRIDSMHEQLALVQKLIDANPNDRQALEAYSPVLEQSKSLDKTLTDFKGKLYNIEEQHEVGEDSIHYLRRFHDRLQELYSSVAQPYNQAPNALEVEESQKLRGELETYLAEFNDLLKKEVADYNRLALDHGAGTLFVGLPIELTPSGGVRQGGQ